MNAPNIEALSSLTPAQRRALLSIGAQGSHARIRADVLRRLHAAGLVEHAPPGRPELTGQGRVVVEALHDADTPAQSAQGRAVDVVEALAHVDHRAAPVGVPGALARMVLDMGTDAERVAALSWLANTSTGVGYLGALKDALIVYSRAGRTYEQTAEHLGISATAVNKAVSRHHARQQTVDSRRPMGDD